MSTTQTKAREAIGPFLNAYRARTTTAKPNPYFGRKCFRK